VLITAGIFAFCARQKLTGSASENQPAEA